MSEEMLADSSALVQPSESAAVDAIVPQPEEAPVEQVKTFTQEELDAAIGKRLAVERRRIEREFRNKAAQVPVEPVKRENFDDPEAFIAAKAEQIAHELVKKREIEQQVYEQTEAFHTKVDNIREKYEDFDSVAFSPDLPITEAMADVIRTSEKGAELAYYLGKNRSEADRISSLPIAQQGAALARLESKISDAPPVKKTSTAPAPISPVVARGESIQYDTTDPRSASKLSASEWIERENQRELAALKAKYAN